MSVVVKTRLMGVKLDAARLSGSLIKLTIVDGRSHCRYGTKGRVHYYNVKYAYWLTTSQRHKHNIPVKTYQCRADAYGPTDQTCTVTDDRHAGEMPSRVVASGREHF
jgi:hypothetical protein